MKLSDKLAILLLVISLVGLNPVVIDSYSEAIYSGMGGAGVLLLIFGSDHENK